MQTLYYIPELNTAADTIALLSDIGPDKDVLFGEYGRLLPWVLQSTDAMKGGNRFVEIILKNKNRELITSSLISAAASGFQGAVIASGIFGEKIGMGKPVYDLDPSQTLMLAMALRKEGSLPGNFRIGLRAPMGSGAAQERVRFFMENGADFVAVTENMPSPEFEDKTVIIKEYKR
jgi:hypothetical protein